MMQWAPMTDPPARTGRYAVCHRGGIAGHAFYVHPDDAGRVLHLDPGWNQVPDFGPTHWCPTPAFDEDAGPARRFWPVEPASRRGTAGRALRRLRLVISGDRVRLSPWRIRRVVTP